MSEPLPIREKHWAEKISRSGYFFGALLLHLTAFILVATWVVFPEFHPPTDPFTKAYLPPSPPPSLPPPPTQPAVEVSTRAPSAPTTPIVAPTDNQPFKLPMPAITPATVLAGMQHDTSPDVVVKPNTLSPERLKKIKDFMLASRTLPDILSSDSDPRNIRAKFVVYLASYADGDWGCNVLMKDGKIDAGSLPNLIAKVGEWSHGKITAEVVPTPLNIGGPDLFDKKPPFIFFTGHKDFKLTDQEVKNLQAYLEMGGLIWGDNTLAGRGSRFDVAFRREMKRVVPDLDKNFEPVKMDDPIFAKSWYPITKLPAGMNYCAEPMEHLDLDGKLAILYTPNDYSDLFCMRILPGDTQMGPTWLSRKATSPLVTSGLFWDNGDVFFRNFTLPSALAAHQLGMNVIGYLLVRFDKELALAP